MRLARWDIIEKKEMRQITDFLRDRFGFSAKLEAGFAKGTDDHIYLIRRELADVDYSKLRVNSLGMYFGEWKNNVLRLSIEGAQRIGHDCTQHILDINEEQLRQWFTGEKIEFGDMEQGFYLVRHGKDFAGCGNVKEGQLLNYVQKVRRTKELIL